MASGTRHFMFNRPDDWTGQGTMDALTALPSGLTLRDGGKGVYTSFALDTLEQETVWHRMRMSATIPGNACVQLLLYCSDSSLLPQEWGLPREQELDGWLQSPDTTAGDREAFFQRFAQQVCPGQEDALLYGLQGRYLWLCLILLNYGGQELSVQSLKLEFPRTAFIDYLPQVYRGADSVNSFLTRFLSVFQSVYVDLEDHMDLAPVRFDPAAAPPEFLHWLAEGLAVSDSFLWSEEQLRRLLRQVVRLYRWKGTRTALCQVVELYTGHRPWVVEQFEVAGREVWRRERETLQPLYGDNDRSFALLLPPGDYGAERCAKLMKIIEQFKPIDAVCRLIPLEDAILLDRHCYLGVNSRIGASRALVLEHGAGRSGAPCLTQSPTGGEL